jgi:uncharacterized protein
MSSLPAAAHPTPPDHPERPSGLPDRPTSPAWPPWSAPAALIAAFGAATVVAAMIGLLGAAFGASVDHPPPAVTISAIVLQDACLIGAALLFAQMVGRPRPWQFGLRPTRLWPALGAVVGGYLVFVLFSYLWLSAVGASGEKDTITQDLGAKDSTVALIAVTFVVTVLAPLAEEFFFRGYFFGSLRRLGLWPAAGLTGLAFGLVHVFGSPIAFIVPLALLGLGLCLLRERTGSLYPGIGLHCVNNSFAMGSTEHWGWQIPVVLVVAPTLIALIIVAGLRLWRTALQTRASPT